MGRRAGGRLAGALPWGRLAGQGSGALTYSNLRRAATHANASGSMRSSWLWARLLVGTDDEGWR